MKIKLFLAAIIFFSFAFLISSQVKFVLAGGPPNPPSAPITSSSVKISGNVSFRVLNRLIPMPSVDVEVKALYKNFPDPFIIHSWTDSSGNYSSYLPPGLYQVRPIPAGSIFYAPPLRFINLKKDTDNVSFWGLVGSFGRG